jgi:uncharacterized protein YqeY
VFLEKANKAEDLAIEQEKKAILEAYLPATFNKEKTKELILEIKEKLAITDLKTQRGMLTKELMANYKGQID